MAKGFARVLVHTKEVREDDSIIEAVIWELVEPVPPCTHRYKYRLFYGTAGKCRVRYDNERGKGDHRHIGSREESYFFVSLRQLLADFQHDVVHSPANWED